jgi:hypothetical protein
MPNAFAARNSNPSEGRVVANPDDIVDIRFAPHCRRANERCVPATTVLSCWKWPARLAAGAEARATGRLIEGAAQLLAAVDRKAKVKNSSLSRLAGVGYRAAVSRNDPFV